MHTTLDLPQKLNHLHWTVHRSSFAHTSVIEFTNCWRIKLIINSITLLHSTVLPPTLMFYLANVTKRSNKSQIWFVSHSCRCISISFCTEQQLIKGNHLNGFRIYWDHHSQVQGARRAEYAYRGLSSRYIKWFIGNREPASTSPHRHLVPSRIVEECRKHRRKLHLFVQQMILQPQCRLWASVVELCWPRFCC